MGGIYSIPKNDSVGRGDNGCEIFLVVVKVSPIGNYGVLFYGKFFCIKENPQEFKQEVKMFSHCLFKNKYLIPMVFLNKFVSYIDFLAENTSIWPQIKD